MKDTIQDIALDDIKAERARQDELHPQKLTIAMRFVCTTEEAGEVAEALQEDDSRHLYKEIIETAASWMRMAEEVKLND
jgi:NTP pyrophosphatase (non-canonical NTP hydrolase)